MQVRDATVGPLSGTTDVSGCAISIVVERHAERVGGDLREDRVGALADLGVRRQHADAAVGGRFEGHHRGQVVLARPGEAGAVHERREPDALPDPERRVDLVEPRALGVIVGDRQRAIEQRAHVDRIAHHLADGARVARANEIAPPQFVRRQTDGGRDAVHVPLEREQTLRRPESTEGPMRRRVGRHGTTAQPHVRAHVGSRPSESSRATARRATACSTRRRR